MRKLILCILACALLVVFSTYGRFGNQPQEVSAQSGQATGEQKNWPWPDSLDAVIAAPGNHKVLLENDRVRVLEVTIKPGEKEPVHAHRWPSILHVDKAGDFRDYDMEGKVIFDSRSVKPPLVYPQTMWMEPQAPHAVENLSKEPIYLIRVELKK